MPEGINNDKPNDDDVVYFGGVIECLDDESCDKLSVLYEVKKEEALLMRKTLNDIVVHSSGNYCKNHVLIDALLMYKTYVELVDDTAFGKNILNIILDYLTSIFKLFRLQSRIIIVLPNNINLEENNLSKLLKHLSDNLIVEIASK
nr:unknown [Spodoptera frugiperda multiple nucleopolyhedrovirus]